VDPLEAILEWLQRVIPDTLVTLMNFIILASFLLLLIDW